MIRISDLVEIYNLANVQRFNAFEFLRHVYSLLDIVDEYCLLYGSGVKRYTLPEIDGVFGYFYLEIGSSGSTLLSCAIWDRNISGSLSSLWFEYSFSPYTGYYEYNRINFNKGNQGNILGSYVDRELDLVINSLDISNIRSFKKGYPVKKKLQYIDVDGVEHSEIDTYSCFAESLIFSINGLYPQNLWAANNPPAVDYAINISFEGQSPITTSNFYLNLDCDSGYDVGLYVVTQSDVQTDECFYEDSVDLDDLNNYYFPVYHVSTCELDIDCEDCSQYEYLMKSIMRSINYLSQLITKNNPEGDEMDYTAQLTAINNSLQAIHSDLHTTVEVEEGQTEDINITQAVVNVSEEKDPLPIVISEGVSGLKAIPFDKINNI